MFMIVTASSDTYITNKILSNKIRVTDANVGRAGTLDLFKLYNETSISSTGSQYELSRILLKFDYSSISSSNVIDISDPSFEAQIKLTDVASGLPSPVNFNVIVFPLSQSFDEGLGRDVVTFNDLDSSNFITASVSNGNVSLWHASGANSQGLLGSSDIDIISSGNLLNGDGIVNLYRNQYFTTGREGLEIDVTKIVSGQMAGVLPNHGFRLSFSGAYHSPHPSGTLPGTGEELDNKTYFVKRFGSRHAKRFSVVPKLIVRYDDTILDHTDSFFSDMSGSVFLHNYHRGKSANILSGSSVLTQVKGDDCIVFKIESGSYQKVITGSQHFFGSSTDKPATGIYSASFLIPTYDTNTVLSSSNSISTISDMFKTSGSITFDSYWLSADKSIGYLTSSLTVNSVNRGLSPNSVSDYFVNIFNLKKEYKSSEEPIINVFIYDRLSKDKVYKSSYNRKTVTIDEMYYSVIDAFTGEVIVPFSKRMNATRLSSSKDGMYFRFNVSSLPKGGLYKFRFMIIENDTEFIHDSSAKFKVV